MSPRQIDYLLHAARREVEEGLDGPHDDTAAWSDVFLPVIAAIDGVEPGVLDLGRFER